MSPRRLYASLNCILCFVEIRELGVGYYAFSGKQEERDSQMKRLEALREETEKRKKANEAKKQKQQVACDKMYETSEGGFRLR